MKVVTELMAGLPIKRVYENIKFCTEITKHQPLSPQITSGKTKLYLESIHTE